MSLIVADAGPINYLIQIGCIELLAQLAEKTVLPASVQAELSHQAAPDAVRDWAGGPPAWVEVLAAVKLFAAKDISPADREAIALARELGAAVLLMDDRTARPCAADVGVVTMGTVGSARKVAAARELVSLPVALERLRRTSFSTPRK